MVSNLAIPDSTTIMSYHAVDSIALGRCSAAASNPQLCTLLIVRTQQKNPAGNKSQVISCSFASSGRYGPLLVGIFSVLNTAVPVAAFWSGVNGTTQYWSQNTITEAVLAFNSSSNRPVQQLTVQGVNGMKKKKKKIIGFIIKVAILLILSKSLSPHQRMESSCWYPYHQFPMSLCIVSESLGSLCSM